MQYDDEYYRDILDGLSAHYDSKLIADLLSTINQIPAPGLGNAWNFNQITGKRWLVNTLAKHLDTDSRKILLLGGWYGVLASLMLEHPAYAKIRVSSLDIDPDCEAVANSLNRSLYEQSRFDAITSDMFGFNYQEWAGGDPAVIVNTSCEHIEQFHHWFESVPTGHLLVLQSNDYFSCDEHVNCVHTLSDFAAQTPLRETRFSGQLKLKKYTRFYAYWVQVNYQARCFSSFVRLINPGY